MATNDSNGTLTATDPPPFIYFIIKELDIFFGIVYLLLGLFGIYSSGNVLWKFWESRKTVKVYPFTLCALVLAANDLMFCTLGICPYAILILAGRPQATSFPQFLCTIFGFVNNFSDRFAWFTITCIMVFRCFITVFTVKLRRVTYKPFIYILTFLALLQGLICILPFFDENEIDIIVERYLYRPNQGECVYGIDQVRGPGMLALIDALWWGPFLACVLSCVVFFIFMKMHARKAKGVREVNKKASVKRKTAILTTFFIICYLPKAILILFDFLINTDRLISWEWLYEKMEKPEKALKLYVYLSLVCKFIFPAIRAAFTPNMIDIKAYITSCSSNTSRASKRSKFSSTASSSSFSLIKSKLYKVDTQALLKKACENQAKTKV
ncbi:hypothetical protein ACHWQZ_G006951 [Mnemiopsis leidyi]